MELALKAALTAILVIAISETSKRSPSLAAVLASLPLTSVLAFIWLYYDTGDTAKVSALSASIFWFVLPSLILFVAFPVLVKMGLSFWVSLGLSSVLTFLGYLAMTRILGAFGINL